MKINAPPSRPPGMKDDVYAEIMRKKRLAANRNGLLLGGIAISFFVFPLWFTTWKNKQGANGMLANKTTAGPGQKSVPLYRFEQENGTFSSTTSTISTSQHDSLSTPQVTPIEVGSAMTPQQQYQAFKQQQQQQQSEQSAQ